MQGTMERWIGWYSHISVEIAIAYAITNNNTATTQQQHSNNTATTQQQHSNNTAINNRQPQHELKTSAGLSGNICYETLHVQAASARGVRTRLDKDHL